MTQQNLLRQRLCLLSVLVLCFWVGWSLFAQLSAGVGAYPAPDNPIAFFPDSYPPPTALHLTPPPDQAPQTFIPSQFAYLPMLTKGYHILFSMTGLVNNQPVGTIVPYGLRTEPYNWGIHTGANVTTPIQAIRSCLHFSPKYYQNQQYTFERWFNPGVVGQICFDPFSQKLAQIVYSLNGLNWPDYTNDGSPEPCLSTQLDPNTPTAETIFQGYVQSHPEWVWLVGNETDQGEFAASVEMALDYALMLDCERVHCMAGLRSAGVEEARLEATYVANLQYAADRLATAGVTVMVEPINSRIDMPGYWLDDIDKARRLLRLIDRDNVRLQLDLYHAQIIQGDLARTIESCLPQIGHIQIADNPGRHEPGTGEIHYPYLFALLDRLAYAGWVGCEYKPLAGTTDGLGWRS